MRATNIDPELRRRVLQAVHTAIEGCSSGPIRPADLELLDGVIEPLIRLVRRTSSRRIGPYVIEVLDEVCGNCLHEDMSQSCPHRRPGGCLLYRHADFIIEAVALALYQAGDADYQSNHLIGSIDLEPDPAAADAPPRNETE